MKSHLKLSVGSQDPETKEVKVAGTWGLCKGVREEGGDSREPEPGNPEMLSYGFGFFMLDKKEVLMFPE